MYQRLLFLIFLAPLLSLAQIDTAKLFKANVKELLNLKSAEVSEQTASIGSFRDAKIREIPGIISVIDNDFIINSGARDLIDLLRLVPGLDFGRDVDDVIGLIVRGNWAFEGKALVMINGMQMNETGYGTFAFKNHFPLEIIEKIEIVRGPGSTIYGGVASLAVINIITKTCKYNDGIELAVKTGYSNKAFTNKAFAVNFNHKFNNGAIYNFSGYANQSTQSNLIDKDRQDSILNYKDSTSMSNEGFISSFQFKNFNYNLIYDNYLLDVSDNPSKVIMKNIINNVSYTIKPTKKISIKPEFTYKWHLPWNYYDGNRTNNDPLTAINNRLDAKLGAYFSPNNNLLFSVGGNYYIDKSRYQNHAITFYDSSNVIKFSDVSAFAEVQVFTKFANVTVGARYDDHSAVAPAFVPRIAITKAFKLFHIKALYSQAFKTPTIQNINAAPNGVIKPENIQVIELEAGFKLNNTLSFNVNVFDNQIRNPIVFAYDNLTASESFNNKPLIYNRGAEAEVVIKTKTINAQANFSTYYNYKNEIPETFIDTLQTKELAAAPRYKATGYISVNLPKKWRLGVNYVYTAMRKSFVYTDSIFTVLELKTFNPTSLLNLSVSKTGLFMPQLRIDLSVNNLLNQKHYYVAAFTNGYNPLPDQQLEFNIRLTYKLGI